MTSTTEIIARRLDKERWQLPVKGRYSLNEEDLLKVLEVGLPDAAQYDSSAEGFTTLDGSFCCCSDCTVPPLHEEIPSVVLTQHVLVAAGIHR